MVAVEYLPDLRERHISQLPDQVYGYVSCPRDLLGALRAADILGRDAVFLRDLLEDAVDRHSDRLSARHEICDRVLCELNRYRGPGQHTERAELLDRALHLSYVRLQVLGEEIDDVVRELYVHRRRLLFEYRGAQVGVRRLDVRRYAPFKSGLEPVLESLYVARRPVGRQDYLLVILIERVEGMEKLLLSRVASGDELDIVYQEYVDRPVLLSELLGRLL